MAPSSGNHCPLVMRGILDFGILWLLIGVRIVRFFKIAPAFQRYLNPLKVITIDIP